MSHGWKGKKDARWLREQQPLAYAVGNRFRRHVRTASNPRGRIIRPNKCQKCPRCIGQLYAGGSKVQIQACHINYLRPFLVIWLCQGCHRKLERGTLEFKKRELHDYESLVHARRTRWIENRRGGVGSAVEVPF